MSIFRRLFAWNPPPPAALRVRPDGCLSLVAYEVLCSPELPTGYMPPQDAVLEAGSAWGAE